MKIIYRVRYQVGSYETEEDYPAFPTTVKEEHFETSAQASEFVRKVKDAASLLGVKFRIDPSFESISVK